MAVNHLKSKGSACGDLGDPDLGDGQGNCNLTRTRAAEALADYLATDPTASGDPDVLVIGDLNSSRMEDPIEALLAAGYEDLIEGLGGDDAYSYLFDGQLGYLDHALASESLAEQVTGVTEWHVNADEIPLFDYNDDVRDATEASFERESSALPLYAADAFRSSDHDPVVIGLDLGLAEPGFRCGGRRFTLSELEADGYHVIVGTPGDDHLTGTAGKDAIFGHAGRDVLQGGQGDDLLCGGRGADELLGNRGDDMLIGGRGVDRLDGGQGADELHAGRGRDVLVGGQGSDLLAGGLGADSLDGGPGNDVLRGGRGGDLLDGGPGHDVGLGGPGNDQCRDVEVTQHCR